MNRFLAATFAIAACSSPKPDAVTPVRDTPPVVTAKPPAPASTYPAARRGDVADDHHGTKIADPYRWMEDMDSTETKAWVAAENKLADAYLAQTPGREALRTRIGELVRFESFRTPQHRGARYFWVYRDGKANQPVVMVAPSIDAPAKVVLDPNEISTDGSLAFAGLSISDDGSRFAYGISIGGGDWQRWHIRDVATGKDLPDELANIKYYQPVFTHDGKGLYYSRFPAPQPGQELVETDHDCKVYFHKLGTAVDGDPVVFDPGNATWQVESFVTHDGRYLVMTLGDGEVGDRGQEQVYFLDLAKAGAKPVALYNKYEAEYLFIGNDGPTFYFQTTAEAPNKRVISRDSGAPAKPFTVVVPEGKQAIEDARLVGKQLEITTLSDAHDAIATYDLRGKKLREVALPGLGTARFSGTADPKEAFYFFTSFTTPGAIYRYDLATGTSKLWKAPSVPFDAGAFETRQVFFASKDGTKVPMFLTAKKGLVLDGANPTIITGYGFGGISLTPYFDATMIPWLEHGGVLGLVNIRGGGEYGEAWHDAGKLAQQQHKFDDFIAAGEWLVANKWTSPAHLGAVGTSGGGFLVGTVTMQRPDLWGATAPIAGVLDLLRFHLFGQGAGWQGDMGLPDDPAGFAVLRTISPLHLVKPGTKYPPMFIVTSDHDVRVAPLHSYKFAAALQAAQAGSGQIVLKVETQSGHGGGSTITQHIEQSADLLAFFARNLGLAL